MTLATRAVLAAFVDDPAGEKYGLEIARSAGIASGTLYPILARLESYRLVEGYFEDPATSQEAKRPPRRYYRLTRDGVELATEAQRRGATGFGGFRTGATA